MLIAVTADIQTYLGTSFRGFIDEATYLVSGCSKINVGDFAATPGKLASENQKYLWPGRDG
jgi:hypothetical protein